MNADQNDEEEYDGNAVPIGNRFTEKRECGECLGKGSVVTQSTIAAACHNCEAKGWNLNREGQPEICTTCQGHRTLQEVTQECGKCDGSGFVVEIVQKFQGKITCLKCEGDGRVKCRTCKSTGYKPCGLCDGSGDADIQAWKPWDGRQIRCRKCTGQGFAPATKPQVLGRKEWENSEIRGVVEHIVGRDWYLDMNDGDTFIINERQSLTVTRCKKCLESTDHDKCFICNGWKLLRVDYYHASDCDECSGLGLMIGPPPCSLCNGSGKELCPVCEGSVGVMFECNGCSAKGRVPHNFVKPV